MTSTSNTKVLHLSLLLHTRWFRTLRLDSPDFKMITEAWTIWKSSLHRVLSSEDSPSSGPTSTGQGKMSWYMFLILLVIQHHVPEHYFRWIVVALSVDS